ncbi:pyridoxal-phosphate-dependent aminotransferase family protein [Burkholderia plantarii]|uniref:Putative aspartate aminotransferase protein n=1 Tax=Burkholderia plantarii TaxID=41899 RepID=A0A0B6RSN2_BURPL|nr:aminotransferase class V-fold PLP-dependent enzyme [Burkholderia plantarii]AJK46353.1 putative aspartate aminotransferase protein [Burkholderia plantarii]ALK30514.1 aspartate aminotransferase [Burkholderia plantarii]GLZ19805.1 aspartate aminotransferase [Burkholderia plantarii]
MNRFDPHLLLDLPGYPEHGYARLADRIRHLLATSADILFVQAEAVFALEAVATSLARPGLTAVNVVTSRYGRWFGAWLRRGGVSVHDVTAAPGQAIALEAVEACAAELERVDIVAAVHAESSTGALNPIAGLAALARAHDALFAVDAVASVGGHPLELDALGIDVAVIGPQKALAGPAGVSAVAVGARAWAQIEAAPDFAPSGLSLAALRREWLQRDRGLLPGSPSALEFWALEAALDRIEAEGIARMVARHAQAARASRAALRALGVTPWIAHDDDASALVTAAPVPPGVDPLALISHARRHGVELAPGSGEIAGQIVRLDHTGLRATADAVHANLVAYGCALEQQRYPVDLDAAGQAIADAYAGE